MIFVGIDPGINGAIAIIEGTNILHLERCPKLKTKRGHDYDYRGMSELLFGYDAHGDKNAVAYIESVSSWPKQGVVSMFNFGKGFGAWLGILHAYGIPVRLARPQDWKSELLAGTDKSKEASIEAAKIMFPDADLKPGKMTTEHDGMAEALLIAAYGKEIESKVK